MGGDAAARWRRELDAWAIPDALLEAAPETPYGFHVRTFADAAELALDRRLPTVSTRRALAGLPEGGSVLDVGCGGGAGGLPLASRAGLVVGVDESTAMLEAFAGRARRLDVEWRTVQGRWPDVADGTPVADVVVCHHVFYNAADLVPFAAALTDHARHVVVVELHGQHPLRWTAPYWRELHGLDRPAGPTAEEAVAVLAEMGLDPTVDRWDGESAFAGSGEEETVAFLRRRLCLPPERDGEIRALLRRHPPPRRRPTVTLSWRGRGGEPD